MKVLLIEDNPGDARLIGEALAEVSEVPPNLEHAFNLSTGLERLAKEDRNVVLLDLFLPDSEGFNTFSKAHAQARQVPIIVLTGLDDEALAIRMISEVAQDYLIKGYLDSGMLLRSIRHAIERKRVEEALRQSEERYRSLVETARDIIFTFSQDGTITSLNPIFETITGWTSTEWLSKPFSSIVHPDDLSFVLEFLQHTLQGHTPPIFELRVLSKSGEYLIAEFTATPQIQDEKVVGILGIARDITKQKKMEEELLKA
jgi:PAS domain S-box-containing protein